VERTKIDPMRIDDVVFAQGYANGEAPCVARYSLLAAGLPIEIPGVQLDRRCGSGLQAVIDAAMRIQTGTADVVIAGGVESMSLAEYYTNEMRSGARMGSVTFHDRIARGRVMSQPIARFGVISGMIETAENLAKDYNISREDCDAYAVMSHQRAAAAWKAGKFDDELVPVPVPQKKGQPPVMFAKDEGIRADASMETLGALPPIEKGGVVTAGNASQQNDAAAACLVVAEDKLKALNLEPMGWFVGWAAAGCEPSRMGIGPVPAVERLFACSKMSWKDIDLVELNEAFAPQVLAVLKGWKWDDRDKLNVNGSGISLGHPIGATGGRILANLLRELQRRKGRYGLETMCIGGGQGLAAIFERA
jgi:acetyl-CoA C-acetyltransferase